MAKYEKVGNLLRAARHGYYWSDKYKLFIRIRNFSEEDNTFWMDVCHEGCIRECTIDGRGLSSESHFVWWEFPNNGNAFLDLIKPLRRRFSSHETLHIGNDGQEICTEKKVEEVKEKPPRKPKQYLNYKSIDLTEDDWALILAIPWSFKSQTYINELRQSNNSRMRTYLDYSQMESMNLQFKKRGLNYRLRQFADQKSTWPKTSVRLWRVEPRN